MRKLLLFTTVLLLGLAACTPDDIPVASVTLNYNTAILAIGETKTKIATVLPENATNRSITWTSSNPVVATVNTNGEVHAIAEGTAIITVTTQDGGRTAISTIIVNDDSGGNNGTCKITDPGVVINGIRWATRNVAAPGTFAANPESAGMLYQWNRQQGWAATGRETPIGWDSSTPTGTRWYATNDPCPEGWRVPSRSELESLVNAGSVWITFYGGVNGHLFGTAPYQIFLPAVDPRNGDGTLYHTGLSSFYWSSTAFTERGAFYMMSAHNVRWSIDSRTFGLSVRCVEDIDIAVIGVKLNKTEITLTIGDSETLIATITPDTATNQNVTWHSSDTSVATVDDWGNVNAISAGTTAITVTTVCGGHTASVDITVQLPPQDEEGIVINGVRWATRNVDAPGTFAAHPESVGMFYQWNRRIGWVARGIGSIPAADWDDTSDTGVKWEAKNDPCPEGWRVPTEAELRSLYDKGSISTTLSGVSGRLFGIAPFQIFLPAAGNSAAYWSSTSCVPWGGVAAALEFSNEQGSWGEFIIFNPSCGSLSTSNAVSVRCVADESIPVQSVTLNKTVITLIAGDTETLTLTIFPESATNQNVTWTSNNPSVATVNENGVVTAISTGTATITVTTVCGGRTASANVTVQLPPQNEDGVVINGVRWATRNVGAPGTFAAQPESTGLFYQWNRRQGWTSLETPNDWGSDLETEEWASANDPCPPGWRVPTTLEFHSLNAGNSVWTTRNGVPGRLFGTAPNQVFLPAAGTWGRFWDWQGGSSWIFHNAGTHGNYWGRTHTRFYDSSGPGGLIFSNEPMPFETGGGYVGSFMYFIYDHSPLNGMSVRCVKDENTLVNSITLSKTAIALPVGGVEFNLHATVYPVWATNRSVTWTSSNPGIVAVENRSNTSCTPDWNSTWQTRVTGVSAGTATITVAATDGSGQTASITVTVENVYISNSIDGVVINGIRWATRNVNEPDTFAATATSFGMLYQWNRRVSWPTTGRYANGWDTSVPTGTMWYAANDPCPPGWRVPTQSELQSLLNTGSIWMTHNGVTGFLFGFGTASNLVFLPNAGERRCTGVHVEPGVLFTGRGYYWSSTSNDNYGAMHLSSGDWISNTFRGHGYSVRCVAE